MFTLCSDPIDLQLDADDVDDGKERRVRNQKMRCMPTTHTQGSISFFFSPSPYFVLLNNAKGSWLLERRVSSVGVTNLDLEESKLIRSAEKRNSLVFPVLLRFIFLLRCVRLCVCVFMPPSLVFLKRHRCGMSHAFGGASQVAASSSLISIQSNGWPLVARHSFIQSLLFLDTAQVSSSYSSSLFLLLLLSTLTNFIVSVSLPPPYGV